ncbi:hypothetical protein MMC21_004078 [Puttea exsequens]|nr:hypothetical protein [Puttea exsequens]
MAGTTMPIELSHGERRAHFAGASDQSAAAETQLAGKQVPIHYVDNYLRPTVSYPANPDGSPASIAGLRSADGHVLAMMPHPERCVLNLGSWVPPGEKDEWGGHGPWVASF